MAGARRTIRVSKGYGDKLLYENLTFSLPPAGIVGIIGPNGAGKTTLLRIALGLVKPTSGEMYFFGKKGLSKENQKRLGYIPQNLGLVNELSVFSNVMMGALGRMPRWRSITGMYPKDLLDDAYSLMYDPKDYPSKG